MKMLDYRKKNESLKELCMQTEQTFETNQEKSNEDEKDKRIAEMQKELSRLRMKGLSSIISLPILKRFSL